MSKAGSRNSRARVRCQLLVLWTAVALASFAACVDLTPPWQKVTAHGAGGGAPIDGPASQGGTSDVDVGGVVDVGPTVSGGVSGSGGAAIDSPPSGGGGVIDAPAGADDGLGGAILDVGTAGAGGAALDGGAPDLRPPGSGGRAGTGGTRATGGAGGSRASGGAGGTRASGGAGGARASGGAPGTGGSTARDAAPDLAPDLANAVEAGALLSGLVVYYPCDGAEADGTTLPDLSGNGNHGMLRSGIPDGGASGNVGYAFTSGVVGSSLLLSASNYGWVNLPPQMFVGLTDLTISVWVKITTSITWEKLIDVGVDAHLAAVARTGMIYMCMAPTTSGKTFAIATNGTQQEQDLAAGASSVIAPADGWTHVAVVLAPSSEVLYVNGEAVATRTNVLLRPKDLGAIDYAFIGRSQFTSDTTFDGAIDEFRVYNRALPPEEVEALYQLR